MTHEEIEALGADLLVADEAGDALRLAMIAWHLYSLAGTASAEAERLHDTLRFRVLQQRRQRGAVEVG